jgi:hypothetical protein
LHGEKLRFLPGGRTLAKTNRHTTYGNIVGRLATPYDLERKTVGRRQDGKAVLGPTPKETLPRVAVALCECIEERICLSQRGSGQRGSLNVDSLVEFDPFGAARIRRGLRFIRSVG